MARYVTRLLAVSSAVTALAAIGAGPGAAVPGEASGPVPVASGLNNPRQLSFAPNGALYVAEAGTGGSGPCVDGAEGEVCFGPTGSVTRVAGGRQSRVITGLPSLAGEGGAAATGPADIVVHGDGSYALVMGLGGNPAVRADLPPAGKQFATVLGGRLGGRRSITADLGAYEAAHNPHAQGVDTNPTSIEMVGASHLIVDAGGVVKIPIG